jgi:hypothetical protein
MTNIEEISGHRLAWVCNNRGVYDYDPTDDGPECEVITRILASQPLYSPSREAELLRFQHFVDKVARAMYSERYGRLGVRRKLKVVAKVIRLHLEEKTYVCLW